MSTDGEKSKLELLGEIADRLLEKHPTAIVETTETKTTIVETTSVTIVDLEASILQLKAQNRADEEKIKQKLLNLNAAKTDRQSKTVLQRQMELLVKNRDELNRQIAIVQAKLDLPDNDNSAETTCKREIDTIRARIDKREIDITRREKLLSLRDAERALKRLNKGA